MMKYLLSATCLLLLLFWPIQAQEMATSTTPTSTREAVIPARYTTVSESNYLSELNRRGLRRESQGLLMESLSGSMVFAELNSSIPFNPASVIKIATSLAALEKFGPDFRFETAIYSTGTLNPKTKVLKGDLILVSNGDPNLSSTDVSRLLRQVIRSGIVRVTGSFHVVGPFAYGSYYTNKRAIIGLSTTTRRLGLRINGGFKASSAALPGGNRIATLLSTNLLEIVFFQNAHSSNPIAERLGNTLGGAKAVQQYLIDEVGIPSTEVHVGRTSGLDFNRITARGTVQLLRALVVWLDRHNLQPQDVLPVAGIDPGTLRTRFRGTEFHGAIVAKTGSLPGTDGGVSTLAGIMYTRDGGPVLFAIFNTKGNVNTARKLQDDLLKGILTEFGGVPSINASSRRSNN